MNLRLASPKTVLQTNLPIPKGAVTCLLICLFLAIGWHAWHIPQIPIWVFMAVVPMGICSYWRVLRGKPLPSKNLLILLTVVSIGVIFLTFPTFIGRDPGMTALILMLSLKLMELKTRRDFMFVVLMCYFLIFGNFLYDQSLFDLAFMVAAFILTTTAIIRLNHPSGPQVKPFPLLRFSFRLFASAIPLTVVLFLLFPRPSGPLWNLPQASDRFKSGLKSFIQPGSVMELARNNSVAFQVEFPDNNMPSMRDLYFRGLILWYTDGKGWYQGSIPTRAVRQEPSEHQGILQTITLQPHNQKWLFGLDCPLAASGGVNVLPGGVVQTLWPIKAPFRYEVISSLNFREPVYLPEVYRNWTLQLPPWVSPGIRDLAQEWLANAADDVSIVRQAEDYFKRFPFVYTLRPGQLDSEDPLADFLFNTRKGFCEHYAATFTLLMRAAGVPARVVAGYQGGEYNPVGNYLVVRQSNAHAWSEVWLEGRGWQRVDPTAWVSPERIQYGMEMSQLSLEGLTEAERSKVIEQAMSKGLWKRLWTFSNNHWDNIRYKWDAWILSYDISRQRNFLRNLGFEQVDSVGLLLAVIIAIPLLLFTFSLLLKRQTVGSDPLLRLYRRFCLKMEKRGLRRMQWEGPVDFEQRADERFPHKAGHIHEATELFVHLRYGRSVVTRERLKRLRAHIRKL